MSAGATLSGQVIFEGASLPQRPKMTVSAGYVGMNPEVIGPSAPPAPVREDGTFTQTGVFGERLIRISGIPTGWALKAVLAGGRDVTDTPMTFEGSEKIAGLQVVLTDRVTHVTVTVTDAEGRPPETAYVVMFPEDPSKWSGEITSRFLRRGIFRAEQSPLKMDGAPPGDYVAAAFKPAQNVDETDPEAIEQLRKAGVRVTLREGESREVALKILDLGTR